MTTENTIAYINENITTIKVLFPEIVRENGNSIPDFNKTYTYKVTKSFAQELKIGNLVIVQAKGTLAIAEVNEIDDETDIDPQSQIDYKWAICKIDFTMYDEARKQELEFIQNVQYKRRAAYRARIYEELGLSKEDIAMISTKSNNQHIDSWDEPEDQ